MNINILNNSKKKKIIQSLNKQYGIEKLHHLFIETGKDKYRIYSGDLSKEEILKLAKATHIEIIGAKLCKQDKENIRLNFDILNLPEIKKQIKTFSTIFLPEEDIEHWIKGGNLDYDTEHPLPFTYLVIKNNNNILGIGQNSKDLIKNYIPKERRVKK